MTAIRRTVCHNQLNTNLTGSNIVSSEDRTAFIIIDEVSPSQARAEAAAVMANHDLHRACCALLRTYIEDRPLVTNMTQVIQYIRAKQAHAVIETVRVLYLNSQNFLIAETAAEGCITHAPVYVRQIVGRAIQEGAASIIIAHNHPSGALVPSKADIDLTKQLVTALASIDCIVHDHVLVSSAGYASFRALGVI